MNWFHRMLAISLVVLGQPAQAAVQRCDTHELRVMTYNVRLDTPADGPNRWDQRRDLFIGQLRLVRPAILGLQEVVPGQRSDIASAMGGYLVLGGGRDDGKAAGEASPLLVDKLRFRVSASGMFWLSPTPLVPSLGWDAAFRRVVTWARLTDRVTGHRILAINTHWDHIGVQARLNSAVQLRGWIAAQRQAGEAVILLGDFNAPLTEASLQVLLVPHENFPGLREARAGSRELPVGGPATFNGWDLVPKTSQTIDHVLVGPGLEVTRYHVLAAHFGGRLASDHFPVIADLAFTRSGKGCAATPRA